MKRVLLFSYEFPPLGGGVATATKNLLQEFAKDSDLKIDLITSSLLNSWEVEKISENIGIYKVPIGLKTKEFYQRQTPLNMFLYVKNSYLQAKDLLSQNKYDLAHFFGYPGAWSGYLLKKFNNLPYIVSLRGVDVPFYNPRFKFIDIFYRPLVSKLWQGAAMVVANSQGLAQLATKTNNRISYEIIPNGVDTDFFKPSKESEKFEKFTVTAGGTIMGHKKGLNYLIEAFAMFSTNKKNIELLLIGDGDLQESLKEQIISLNIQDKVLFVGRKDREWLKINLSKCHVFCLPSLNEGMSNATLEAMACGLPLILTPVGGSQELLKGNGFLVPKFDFLEIARRLELLYADKRLRIEMGKDSRIMAEKMSWEIVKNKYMEIYENS